MDRKTQIWARCRGAAATASAGCKAARERKLPPEIFPLLFTLLEPKREEEGECCFAEAEDYRCRGLHRAQDSPGRILGGLRLLGWLQGREVAAQRAGGRGRGFPCSVWWAKAYKPPLHKHEQILCVASRFI